MERLLFNSVAENTLGAWESGGRFPHAILLEGPAGSGRRTFARQIAAAVFCECATPRSGDCRHCVKLSKDIHPDYQLIAGGESAQSFHVKAVREVRLQASVRPNEARARVFLLHNAHSMSPQAQNALLKIMEEPPRNVYFVLTCTDRNRMLPTVLSRVTAITLELPTAEQCAEVLPRFVPGHSDDQYAAAALAAGGNLGRAIGLLSDGAAPDNPADTVLRCLAAGDEIGAMAALEPIMRNRGDFAELLAQMRSTVFRQIDSLVSPVADSRALLRHTRLIDIIDDVAAANERNGNALLLSAVLCARAHAALAN